MIKQKCHHCGKELIVPDEYAGMKGSCNHCGQPLTILKPHKQKHSKDLVKAICIFFGAIFLVGMIGSAISSEEKHSSKKVAQAQSPKAAENPDQWKSLKKGVIYEVRGELSGYSTWNGDNAQIHTREKLVYSGITKDGLTGTYLEFVKPYDIDDIRWIHFSGLKNPSTLFDTGETKSFTDEEEVKMLSKTVLPDDKEYEILFHNGVLEVTQKPTTELTIEMCVKETIHDFVNMGQTFFASGYVSQFQYYKECTFTDSYGKDSSNNGVIIYMDKGEFDKYNWEGLAGSPIIDRFKRSCIKFWLHPGIEKNINPNSITLY